MNKELARILDSYRDEMIETLRALVHIPSVRSESAPNAPYGLPIQEALEALIALGREKGFGCINYENQVCEISIHSDAPEAVGIVSHIDVVPAGNDWTHDPFGGAYIDGKIFGRGAIDNKGPLVAAFYACLAIQESKLKLTKKIKHIIGTNEESGSFQCLEYYKAHADIPSVGIVPDSWFPAAYAEKGFLSYEFRRQFKGGDAWGVSATGPAFPNGETPGIELLAIRGGEALNMVAAEAQAKFAIHTNQRGNADLSVLAEKIHSVLERYKEKDRVRMVQDGNVFRLSVSGTAAHASTPELGENAIAGLLRFLAFLKTELLTGLSPVWETIEGLVPAIAQDTNGKGLDIDYSDPTGDLTNNVGLISFDDGCLKIGMNLRSPVTLSHDELEAKLQSEANNIGMDYRLLNYNPHYYIPADDPLIVLLTEVYREATGDLLSLPIAHGGGSYARVLKNFVPFGPSIPGEPLLFHKQDEHITGDRLLLLSKIYAEALYQLAK